MSYVVVRKSINLEQWGITEHCLMEILNIRKASARDLLSGNIAFTMDEIAEIARRRNIDLNELLDQTA